MVPVLSYAEFLHADRPQNESKCKYVIQTALKKTSAFFICSVFIYIYLCYEIHIIHVLSLYICQCHTALWPTINIYFTFLKHLVTNSFCE